MAERAERPRALGFWSLLALGINGVVGVGIFFAPAAVAALVPGRAGIWVYALTGLMLVPIASAYAMLGGRFDEDGGPYVWARAAFGPTAGFAVGWIAYVSALFSSSAVVAGLCQHAGPLFGFEGAASQRGLAALAVVALAVTASSGLRPSALVWSGITVLKLMPLLLLVGLFVTAAPRVPAAGTGAVGDWARAALVVVFATQGFEIVPVPAGNARRSARAVPLATLGSLLLCSFLYVLLHAACVSAVPDLSRSEAPLVAAAAGLGGARASSLVAIGTNVSALGIAFGMFAMTPRYLAALGHDDGLGPWVAREDRRAVPQRALWLSSAIVLVAVLSGRLMELFALSSVAVLAQYSVSVASLAALAWRRARGLRLVHLWPVPLALGPIVLVARAAKRGELAIAAGVLLAGGILLVVRRVHARLR
jgi:basic amino acid/polyamine antiporter, APA family